MRKKGYYPAKTNFRTFLFSFNRIIKDRLVRENVRVKDVKIKIKNRIFIRKFSKFGYDFIPRIGRQKRPTLSFNKILAGRQVKEDFSYTPIRSQLPAKFGKHYFLSTDCPFSSEGILGFLDTGAGFFASIVKGRCERITLWEVFGE